MCLISFAYKVDKEFDLVVAANRDEYYHRPTAQADYWEDAPHVLAGRDLEKMRTWMGVTKSGRFAALTNYRDPNEDRTGKRSRGEVVSHYLIGKEHPLDYLKQIQRKHKQFPGFNIIIGDRNSLFYYSNIVNEIKKLNPGLYGLSNHLLDTPWPKVRKGKEGLKTCLENSRERIEECLFSSLQCADPARDEELPKTGVSLEWERVLSPLFIQTPSYGTRCSTLLLMNQTEINYFERTHIKGEIKLKEYTLVK